MRHPIYATAALAACVLTVTSAVAQDAAPVPTAAPAPVAEVAVPAPACELHVFPTLEGQAQTTGWLSGFGIVGAVADAASNKSRNVGDAAYLKEALGPKMQVDALKTVDLIAALKLPPSQVIFETPIADRKITTKATTRLTSSTAPCYVELLVTQNFYKKAALYGRSLNNRYIFKDFRTGKTKTAMVKGRGGNGLSLFPPKTTDEAAAAEKELSDVFVKNFMEFAKTIKPAK
jgi:hypothetical protein